MFWFSPRRQAPTPLSCPVPPEGGRPRARIRDAPVCSRLVEVVSRPLDERAPASGVLEPRRVRGCAGFLAAEGAVGADEVVVDAERLAVRVGVSPGLESPEGGVLVPLGEGPPEPLQEVCAVPPWIQEPVGVVHYLVGDRLLQAQVFQGRAERRVRVAHEDLREPPGSLVGPPDDGFRLELRLPPDRGGCSAPPANRSPGPRAGRPAFLRA